MSATEKTYEMHWDCEYCGSRKLLGLSQRFCPTCGAPQNPTKRYFPSDEEKVAVEDHPYVGADVQCPACRQPMSRACAHCSNCGSPLEAGKQVATHGEQNRAAEGAWKPSGTAGGAGARSSRTRTWLLVGAVLAVVVGAIVFFSRTKDARVTVAKLEWSREVVVERFGEVEEKGACSRAPSDARIVDRSTPEPVCTTKRTDNGDGTFKEKKECSEPVEQCTYRVNKWSKVDTAKTTGGVDEEPRWPAPSLRQGECRGCERLGERKERLSVRFDGPSGTSHSCDMKDAATWKSYAVGAKYRAKITVVGGGLVCSSLAPL